MKFKPSLGLLIKETDKNKFGLMGLVEAKVDWHLEEEIEGLPPLARAKLLKQEELTFKKKIGPVFNEIHHLAKYQLKGGLAVIKNEGSRKEGTTIQVIKSCQGDQWDENIEKINHWMKEFSPLVYKAFQELEFKKIQSVNENPEDLTSMESKIIRQHLHRHK